MNIMGVYKIVNCINGKIYIGSTNVVKRRKIEHYALLRRCKHPNPHLQSSWDKYGEENFRYELLEQVDESGDLIKREQYWIDLYNSKDANVGYNICEVAGTTLGFKQSDETIRKMKLYHTGRHQGENNNFYGKKHTPEVIENIRNGFRPYKGGHLPESTRRKISEGRIGEKNWMYGKLVSEETKSKMAFAQQGEKSCKAKLIEREVLAIKYLSNAGIVCSVIAKFFAIDKTYINDIKMERRWKHLSGNSVDASKIYDMLKPLVVYGDNIHYKKGHSPIMSVDQIRDTIKEWL